MTNGHTAGCPTWSRKKTVFNYLKYYTIIKKKKQNYRANKLIFHQFVPMGKNKKLGY